MVDELRRFSFRSWLLDQTGRQDDVGRAARWLEQDPGDDGPSGRRGPQELVDRIERAARSAGDVSLMAGAVAGLEEWGRLVRGQGG